MNHQLEIDLKTARLARLLRAENLGGVILNSQPNFAWITAGGNNGVDRSRENGVASVLVRADGKRFVLASRIEMPRILAEEVSSQGFESIEYAWEAEKAEPDFVIKLAQQLLNNNELLGSDLLAGEGIRNIEPLIAKCRYQLTATEIERYRKLGEDAGHALGEFMKTLEPGETELEIAQLVQNALAARQIQAVVTLVAADERLQKFRHPVPTQKHWEKTLMVVICAKRHGLVASLSRIVCVGTVPAELQLKTEACARVNAALWAETKPGTTGAEAYQIAARAYTSENFGDEIHLHHQGGAAGYRTRDWTAHPASHDVVHLNQAFAWNPSISGTKTEETCLVFEDRIEVITMSPDWAQIKVERNGREYSLPGVLSI